MDFKIEKNIPMFLNSKEDYKYPFQEMEVGDSFNISCNNGFDLRNKRNNVLSCAQKFKKIKTDFKISTRNTTLFNLRVWRVK
jgi:outer membrane protein W